MVSQQKIVQEVRNVLRTEGIGPALRLLNHAGTHRFTAAYYFDGGTLCNLYLVDRKDPSVDRTADLPVTDSYCVFVRQTARTFSIDRALQDERVAGHPKQKVVQSYCGVPLFDGTELLGTICHFDYESIPISDEEAWALNEVAPDLALHIRENVLETREPIGRSAPAAERSRA